MSTGSVLVDASAVNAPSIGGSASVNSVVQKSAGSVLVDASAVNIPPFIGGSPSVDTIVLLVLSLRSKDNSTILVDSSVS